MRINLIKFSLVTSFLCFSLYGFSQNQITMKASYGSGNQEIDDLMFFEQIGLEKLSFESEVIKGKTFEIVLKEYKKGKLKSTKKLFDGGSYDFFKIDSSYTSMKFYFKYSKSSMDVFIKAPQFGSDKKSFKLYNTKDEYILKDFLGSKSETKVPLNQEFPILAIITPSKQEDGYSSYCEVAQSNIDPSLFGQKFNIPHYFVIYMKFK